PCGQECAAATFTSGRDGEVLVLASWDKRSRPLHSAVAYSPRTGKWRSLPGVPSARAGAGAVTIERADGSIHIFLLGGTPDATAVEEYVLDGSATSAATTEDAADQAVKT